MKYFIDTEFIEGTQTRRVLSIPIGTTKPTIDLISIGIVTEDGREYYAISNEFNLYEAWNRWQPWTKPEYAGNDKRDYWIRDNVLKPIYEDLLRMETDYLCTPTYYEGVVKGMYFNQDKRRVFTYKDLKNLLSKYGKTNATIAEEIKEFTNRVIRESHIDRTFYCTPEMYADAIKRFNNGELVKLASVDTYTKDEPEFYAYYADYDWVAFCWLFGKMIDLPKGFPMYCVDLKQTLDSMALANAKRICSAMGSPLQSEIVSMSIDSIKACSQYPEQTDEHNALADARWNKQLYDFLNTI